MISFYKFYKLYVRFSNGRSYAAACFLVKLSKNLKSDVYLAKTNINVSEARDVSGCLNKSGEIVPIPSLSWSFGCF